MKSSRIKFLIWTSKFEVIFWLANLSLFSDTLISAAHCCAGFHNKANFVRIFLGEHNTRKMETGQFDLRAKKIIIHPEFQRRTLVNDICVIKTESMDLRAKKTAAPACLPARHGLKILKISFKFSLKAVKY